MAPHSVLTLPYMGNAPLLKVACWNNFGQFIFVKILMSHYQLMSQYLMISNLDKKQLWLYLGGVSLDFGLFTGLRQTSGAEERSKCKGAACDCGPRSSQTTLLLRQQWSARTSRTTVKLAAAAVTQTLDARSLLRMLSPTSIIMTQEVKRASGGSYLID